MIQSTQQSCPTEKQYVCSGYDSTQQASVPQSPPTGVTHAMPANEPPPYTKHVLQLVAPGSPPIPKSLLYTSSCAVNPTANSAAARNVAIRRYLTLMHSSYHSITIERTTVTCRIDRVKCRWDDRPIA